MRGQFDVSGELTDRVYFGWDADGYPNTSVAAWDGGLDAIWYADDEVSESVVSDWHDETEDAYP